MSFTEKTIGSKKGCFTIIGSFNDYQNKIASEKIKDLEEKRVKFINGEIDTSHNFTSVETFDRWIEDLKDTKKYIVKCSCGKIYHLTHEQLFRKRYRYCGEDCGVRLKKKKETEDSLPREKDVSYYYDLLGKTHESLDIIECIDENCEGTPLIFDNRTKGKGRCLVYKKYKCRCYLCGKEYSFRSDEFEIHNDRYGTCATKGYYSKAHCECHEISSFQWRIVEILNRYKVNYRVEKSFTGLYGTGGKQLLKYDFVILDEANCIKCLIECQGEQHYNPVNEFGGEQEFIKQMKNDDLKRIYANENKIPLIEISYLYKRNNQLESLLHNLGIISADDAINL